MAASHSGSIWVRCWREKRKATAISVNQSGPGVPNRSLMTL